MDILVSFKPTSSLKNHKDLREQLLTLYGVISVDYVSEHLTLLRIKHSLEASNVKVLTDWIRTHTFIDDLSFDPKT